MNRTLNADQPPPRSTGDTSQFDEGGSHNTIHLNASLSHELDIYFHCEKEKQNLVQTLYPIEKAKETKKRGKSNQWRI